jgi:hypothetical protein
MSVPTDRLPHFESSILALARVAFQETRAIGFTLFQKTDEAPGLLRVAGLGAEISVHALLEGEILLLVAFPLHTGDAQDGFVAFSFEDRAASDRAREPLASLRDALEIIWAARFPDARHFELVAGIGTLEARLMDSKIADRAQGLLAGERGSDPLGAIASHVRTVVRPGVAIRTLESIAKELEDELEERRVTGQAKALLQATHSLSEKQAYTHLRVLSRKSRRPLKDVAMDVIATLAVTTSAA